RHRRSGLRADAHRTRRHPAGAGVAVAGTAGQHPRRRPAGAGIQRRALPEASAGRTVSAPDLVLAALFLAVTTLYASVGHAGASGYIAAMALMGFAPEQVRPTALALNLLVGGIRSE